MAQPRLLAPPQTSQPSTPSVARTAASAPTASKSSAYRLPTATSTPSGARPAQKGNPFLEPKRKPSPPKPAAKPPAPKLDLNTLLPKIDKLRTTLTETPYLLSLQFPPGKRNNYTHNNAYNEAGEAFRTTPFKTWEWERLQYMSLVEGDSDRELVVSRGAWEEEIRALDPWGEGPTAAAGTGQRSGSGTPWNGGQNSGGSGNNTVGRMGDRKKVSFGDYLKKKNSPGGTPVKRQNEESKRPELPKVMVNGNGVLAEKSQSSQSQEARKEASIPKPETDPYAIKPDVAATYKEAKQPVITNGHGLPPKSSTSQSTASANDRAKPHSQSEKEEGELADEPSIPSAIANILKAPVGKEPQQATAQKERPKAQEPVSNKRPLDDKKREEGGKRQKIERQTDGADDNKPYTGTARPHQRNISSESKPATPATVKTSASHPLSRPKESERPRKDESDKRRDERRDGSGLGSKTTAMPRLLSPLPDHLASSNGTPMVKGDSREGRRERSPMRPTPMQTGDSKDSRRGDRSPVRRDRERSPPKSQPMAKSDSRDSRRGDRSPPRSHPMQKGDSRDSRRDRSPARRERSPPRSQPMAKSDSKDSNSASKPRVRMPWEKPAAAKITSNSTANKTVAAPKTTSTPSSNQKREDRPKAEKKEDPKKEPLPMPSLLSFELPPLVEADMKRRLDAGDMADDAARAFKKHKRNISSISNLSSLSNGSKGRETREDTPMTDAPESSRKKTSTQALRERARKPDTPGVARKAVASKTKARQQDKLVVKLKYKHDLADTVSAILQGKTESGHEVRDYQGRRGREMIARRAEVAKSKERSKRARPSPSEDEDQSPVKRQRNKDTGPSTPIPSSSSQALAPPSISKLKNEKTPEKDKAGTPGETGTPTAGPVSPTATRSVPSINIALTSAQKELVKGARGESDKYITLGTTLKRQRDALIRPSPSSGSEGSKSVSEVDAKKANIMGVESLLAYLVGFEAMDRAYKLEGARNKGAHWKSLFPYLDSFRLGLKSSTTDEKAKVVLDIVATLVGYTGASCLAGCHNSLLEKEGPPNSRDEMATFIKEQTANFKRREAMGEGYRRRCVEVSERWPEMVREDRALGWARVPGGQFVGVEEVKGKLGRIVGEICKESKVEWESKLDF